MQNTTPTEDTAIIKAENAAGEMNDHISALIATIERLDAELEKKLDTIEALQGEVADLKTDRDSLEERVKELELDLEDAAAKESP